MRYVLCIIIAAGSSLCTNIVSSDNDTTIINLEMTNQKTTLDKYGSIKRIHSRKTNATDVRRSLTAIEKKLKTQYLLL